MSFPAVLRSVLEIGLGVAYGVGAVFNAAYTLGHGDDFYGGFARGAWFGPGRWLVEHVVLREPVLFTVLLVLFELTLAIMILSRTGLVTPALYAGAGFCIVAALVSSPAGTAANLTLAVIQLLLAATR